MPDVPSWMDGQPLIMVGSWDSTPIFKRRRGMETADVKRAYRRRYSVETAEAVAALGVNLAVVDFFKAFGLAAEGEFADGLRDFVSTCKSRGVRIGAYVGSTIGYETFLVEVPEAKEWLLTDPAGGYQTYPNQSFRATMYFPHPGYRAYIKRVLTAAIQDFGAEEIHFDSASVMADEPIFFHQRGIEDFRKYLGAHFSPEEMKDRFGFADPAHVEAPKHVVFPDIDPLMQTWTRFRCDALIDYFTEMRAFIKALNPDVAVSVNTVCGISLRNIELGGVDHSRLLPLTDILWNEELDYARLHDGILISRIRSYKMVAGQGKRMLAYSREGDGDQAKLMLAESMAYNHECMGMIGEPLDCHEFPPNLKAFVDFYRGRFELYRGMESAAEVAVLHSFATMTFNPGRPRISSMLFQQVLIQNRVPFDIIFDQQLADLSKYRVLILPSQEALSAAQVESIRAFVAKGGSLFATEFTSLFDEHRIRLDTFQLNDLFGGIPTPSGTDPLQISTVMRDAGDGRVVYRPSIAEPAITANYPLPPAAAALMTDLQFAFRDSPQLESEGPATATVTVELKRNPDGSLFVLHLLNFATPAQTPPMPVRLRLPEGKTAAACTLESPESPDVASIDSAFDGTHVSFTVPAFTTYCVIAIRLS